MMSAKIDMKINSGPDALQVFSHTSSYSMVGQWFARMSMKIGASPQDELW